uniref:Ribonuclease H-like domain-containing protein n=1 Tax=Tanacetum cinerariifolium TaxID=118510 RepID=A0A6L2NCF4_TANCI|nr:ribonuclease H-like domain-containing protein [Tanacetum cinerariifolium]
MGKALDAGLVVTKTSGTESDKHNTRSRSGNGITYAMDADIRPVYDQVLFAEIDSNTTPNSINMYHRGGEIKQNVKKCQVSCPLLDPSFDNMTTIFSNQFRESKNIFLKKTVAQLQKDFSRMEAHCVNMELKYQNEALKDRQHRQILNETSDKAKIKKEIEVLETINIELGHSVAKLFKENEKFHKKNEHLKQTYKDLYDSIKKTRVQTKDHNDSLIAQINSKTAENTKDHNDSLIAQINSKTAENVDLKAQIQEKMIDYALWKVIENGETLTKTQVVEGVTTVMPITTVEEKAQRRLEVKARSTLMMGIPNEHQLNLNSIKDAKQLLEVVEKRFEMLDQTFDMLQKLVSQLELLDEKLSQEDVNQKLRSLSLEWNTHVVVWRNKANLDTMSMDDLYNNLKMLLFVHSWLVNQIVLNLYMRTWNKSIQMTMRARRFLKKKERKLTVNGNETIGFHKFNVKCYNCHKRGHFSRKCRALRNQDNKHKESSRRSVPVETSHSTALVSCDGLGGYDWSNQAKEGPNYALMAFSSLSSDSMIVDNYKKGLGYGNYNAVPPPYTRNFMPPTPDLSFTGLDEFVNKAVAVKCKAKSRPKAVVNAIKGNNLNAVKASAYEAIHKELGDSLVMAATTDSSLEAEQDSGNINKTQSKATPNESSSQGTNSGNTLQSDEDRLKLNELMVLCTTLQNMVLDLEKTKTSQRNKIDSLKRRDKKLKKRNRSRTHNLKRLYKVGLTARVESSKDEESLGDEEVFVAAGQNENVVNITIEELTLAQVLEALKTSKPKVKGLVIQETDESTTTTIPKQQSQDNGKGIMIEEPVKSKKKD